MEPKRTPQRHKGMLIIVFAVMALAVLAIACHPRHRHADGVHDEIDAEQTCVQLHTAETTVEEVRDALLPIQQDDRGWQSRDTLNFNVYQDECDTGSSAIAEIEAHIWDDVVDDGACSAGLQACVEWRDLESVHDEIEEDYDKIFVHFNARDIVPGAKLNFLVNHEYGHVVGLADPTPEPDVVDSTAEHCLVWVKVDFMGKFLIPAPVVSIMHDRYCAEVSPGSDLEWPTMFDFISFDENVR